MSLSLRKPIYVCVCLYIGLYIYVCVCVYVYICVCVCECVCGNSVSDFEVQTLNWPFCSFSLP